MSEVELVECDEDVHVGGRVVSQCGGLLLKIRTPDGPFVMIGHFENKGHAQEFLAQLGKATL